MRILFLVNDDWYFWSHRLALAQAVRDRGVEVFVMTHISTYQGALESENFRVIPWRSMRSRSVNPFRELRAISEVILAYRRIRPDLVHHISIKPAIYGGIAAVTAGGVAVVQTIAGLGYLFTDPPRRFLWLRWLALILMWLLARTNKIKTIFQNEDDRELFVAAGIFRSANTALIKGSGIDVEHFQALPEPGGVPVAVLPARMLWDKGVAEFVDASRELRARGVKVRFALAGRVDGSVAGSVCPKQITKWSNDGIVEWWGYIDDIRVVLAKSSIICLPSYYREGLPKILLEAAACQRATITTDSPGCREAVRHGENGFLVPPRDSKKLAEAIEFLSENPDRRAVMGKKGREMAVEEFSRNLIITQTLRVYSDLVEGHWPVRVGTGETRDRAADPA